jgi:phospholipase D1/2
VLIQPPPPRSGPSLTYLSVCSKHTKEALELHPNIAVFRHPDHAPSGQVIESEFLSSIKNFSLKSLQLAEIPEDAFKAIYGVNKDVVLYWAHHEKLCLVDGDIAFMGGLDLCFGRWDTNQHPIADAHPTDLNQAIFPGQDFNNARVMDFEDVTKWDQNKLDRTKNSRMGWSDLSICLRGPVVQDLKAHFVQRWDFIYDEKYNVRNDQRYNTLELTTTGIPEGYYRSDGKTAISAMEETNPEGNEAPEGEHQHRFHFRAHASSIFDRLRHEVEGASGEEYEQNRSGMSVQLVRSCTRWSNGVSTEVWRSPYLTIIGTDRLALYRKRLHGSHPQ